MTTGQRAIHGMCVFTVIWFGQLISTLGSSLTGFALGIWIYQETGSTTLFAISLVVWVLPEVLIAPVAGVIADRWDRRLAMILSDSMAGLSTVIIGVILLTGHLAVWHIYIVQVFLSAAGAFQWPAYSAATSLLVPKEHLGRAGGMSQIGSAVSTLAAPAIAGALFVTTGLKSIILIDILTYLFALSTLVAVRFPQPEAAGEEEEKRGSFFREASYGWKYIRARPGLFGLLIVFASLNFLLDLTTPLLIPMLLDMTTPDIVGYAQSISGAGMLVGTLVMSAWGGPKRRVHGIFIFESLTGLFTLLLGLRPSIPLIAAGWFGIMLAMPITNGCSQAMWQSKVAPGVQGRVFAIRRMIAFSVIPVAYMLAGPLAENVFNPLMIEGGLLAGSVGRVIGVGPGRGAGLLIAMAGALYTLTALAIKVHPRIRRLEIEIPDALPADEPLTEAEPA